MRVVTSAQMKEIEVASLQYDLTYHRLMDNAGSAAAAFIRRTFQVEGLNCIILCGSGNNGGDGFVVARKLYENNANVLVVMVGNQPKSSEAAAMYATAKMMEIPIINFHQNTAQVLPIIEQADIIVDAIYGTGFTGELHEAVKPACKAINHAIAAVVALDIPSGVHCDTESFDPDAVRADFTVVFDSHKPCHLFPKTTALCGQIELADIGIPPEAHQCIAAACAQLTTEQVFAHLPPRDIHAHKGTHGKVVAVCGSSRYRGAAVLCVMGALRLGAGLVTLASTETVCATVAHHIPEATFLPLPENKDGFIHSTADTCLPASLQHASAIVVGCGLGQFEDAKNLLHFILSHADAPLIIDADGINALAGNIDILQTSNAPVILTPHPGEIARLCGCDVAAVQADRTGIACQFALQHHVVVVLKGHETVIADTDGKVWINSTGNAGLAKGGSGDVLSGMIAALCGQGIAPIHAAVCAVHLHGLAADRTAKRRSQYGMLPSELLEDLTDILAENGR